MSTIQKDAGAWSGDSLSDLSYGNSSSVTRPSFDGKGESLARYGKEAELRNHSTNLDDTKCVPASVFANGSPGAGNLHGFRNAEIDCRRWRDGHHEGIKSALRGERFKTRKNYRTIARTRKIIGVSLGTT